MLKDQQKASRIIKINFPGGFVPVGDLLCLLESLHDVGVQQARIGTRQQMYFSLTDDHLIELEYELSAQELTIDIDQDSHPNIMSSYVADGIFTQGGWVREGIYKDIISSFDYKPKLKINIAENNQSLVPFYTGNLNFISSKVSNYWHLYIRWPKTNHLYVWSTLVYSLDIAAISNLLENLILDPPSIFSSTDLDQQGIAIEKRVVESNKFHFQPKNEDLTVPEFRLPYYEGFNKHEGTYWLGIYRPDEVYTTEFLLDICKICQQTRVGQFYTTPWKSLIIKDIQENDRYVWDLLLDKHRFNLRHSSNELNWQTQDWSTEALGLKKSVVNYFNLHNIRTYRLSFGVKIDPSSDVWGCIMITKTRNSEGTPRYEVQHTSDFNANSRQMVPYRSQVSLRGLPKVLNELCYSYYHQRHIDNTARQKEHLSTTPQTVSTEKHQYQCPNCLSIYDSEYGDALAGIHAGTAFEELPESYQCGLCQEPKRLFKKL